MMDLVVLAPARWLATLLFVFSLVACGSGRLADPSSSGEADWTLRSRIALQPAAPAPGTNAEQLALWTGWVRERFLDPELRPERRSELDASLRSVHVLELTPAFLNNLDGLDMAAADDVERGTALVDWWYREQGGLTTVYLDVSGAELSAVAAGNRILSAESWARWWDRKAKSTDAFERLRLRVDELLAEHAKLGISLRKSTPEGG